MKTIMHQNIILSALVIMVSLVLSMPTMNNLVAVDGLGIMPLLSFQRVMNCSGEAIEWSDFLNQENLSFTHGRQMNLTAQQLDTLTHKNICQDGSSFFDDTVNLNSVCPWTYQVRELGVSYYPRYIQEASCSCVNCIGDGSLSCQFLRGDIVALNMSSCTDGRRTVSLVRINIPLACYCSKNKIQSK